MHHRDTECTEFFPVEGIREILLCDLRVSVVKKD